jgi:4-hydroxybenzoate polyprenyltransferase
MVSKVTSYVKLLRPQQWVKNTFIFIPAFFGGNILYLPTLINLLAGFAAFSLLASAVYVLNDWIDVEQDRLHPQKRNRPLASGAVSKSEAAVLAGTAILLSVVFTILLINTLYFTYILLLYFTLNLLYSFKLKKISIVDIVIIAIGFLLRICAGGVLGGVLLSKWIIIMTFLLALFLAFAKRRDDVLLNMQGVSTRQSIKGYNLEFISSSMVLMSSVIMIAYIMYTVSPEVTARSGHDLGYVTSFWVIVGILRYLQLTIVEERSGDPTKLLLKDRFLFLTVSLWIVTNFGIIYLL